MTDFLEELLKAQEVEDQEQTWTVLPNRPVQAQGVFMDTDINNAAPHSSWPNELFQETKTTSPLTVPKRTLLDGNQTKRQFEPMTADRFLYAEKRVGKTRDSGEENSNISWAETEEMPLADSMKRVHRAVQMRVKQNAQAAESPARVSGQDVGFYRDPAGKERHASSYIALVDAAFARDARRYDGPLRLL